MKSKNEKYSQPMVLGCECHDREHNVIFDFDEDTSSNGEKYKLVYATYHLSNLPFWERLKLGIKYIFGYKSRYGCYDELVIGPDNVKVLKDVVNFFDK